MAILPAIPAFSTAVIVNGEPADEYQPPGIPIAYDAEFEGVPRTRCFIPAETGNTYSVRFRLSPRFDFGIETDTLLFAIYIDGALVEETIVYKELLREQDFIDHIKYRHQQYADGSLTSHEFCFRNLAPAECTTAATLNTDMQLVKTLGTIRVVLKLAKNFGKDPSAHPCLEEEISRSLEPSWKALALNGHGQTHGTSYMEVDVNVPITYYAIDIRETIGCFDFVYLSPDILKVQGIMDPKFINQAAQGMPQTFEPAPEPPRFPARTMSNGCLEIDLTGDDE
ncbi:hypothetical protein F25303_11938 [Fusarium sp. NRRL 25303]|nr:hypothetical protein F25303_11938 [Fusarium sp. NRRL 25303]